METCTVETGLLRKKPCGHAAVTHCANCEQPLCKQHAVAQAPEPGKPRKFMCKECDAARREFEKNVPPAAPEKPAEAAKAAAPAGAAAPKPAAPAAPAAKGAAPAKEAPVAPKPDDDAPLEFTPSKDKK